MRHVNIGEFQVIWWPRWTLFFYRRNIVVYRLIVYVWPFEFRWFDRCL